MTEGKQSRRISDNNDRSPSFSHWLGDAIDACNNGDNRVRTCTCRAEKMWCRDGLAPNPLLRISERRISICLITLSFRIAAQLGTIKLSRWIPNSHHEAMILLIIFWVLVPEMHYIFPLPSMSADHIMHEFEAQHFVLVVIHFL
jgi:hypothetical protein